VAKPKEPRHEVITTGRKHAYYAARRDIRMRRRALHKREKPIATNKRMEHFEERTRRALNARPRSD
jgi:hypothetical protein